MEVAGVIKPIVNKGRKNESGNIMSDANEITSPGIYTFPRVSNITENTPPFADKGLMMKIIVSSYDNTSLHQTAISGSELHTREYYDEMWHGWV